MGVTRALKTQKLTLFLARKIRHKRSSQPFDMVLGLIPGLAVTMETLRLYVHIPNRVAPYTLTPTSDHPFF